MRDNQLFAAIGTAILDGLIANGTDSPAVRQNFEPTQQGLRTKNTVYLFKVSDKRYGFLKRESKWDESENNGLGAMVHTESQYMESVFQINALALQDPKITDLPTASDLINDVASILQSDVVRNNLLAQGIGALRVMDIRNTPFPDDADRNEFNPSFDFTVTHQHVIVSTTPAVESYSVNIARI